MDPDSRRLGVTVTDGRGRPLPDGGLARWLATVAPARVRGDVAIAIVSDRQVRTLNARYRRIDAPTDVLSFPAAPPDDPRAAAAGQPLGDIVIARGVAGRQAREAGHAFATELRVLALHGLLHLLGYDHEHAADRGRMARTEARLRRKGGLRAGLIARSRSTPRPERREGSRPGAEQKRLRPTRAAGGQRGAAAPASVRRAGVPASAGRQHRIRPATARSRRSARSRKLKARGGGGPHAPKK